MYFIFPIMVIFYSKHDTLLDVYPADFSLEETSVCVIYFTLIVFLVYMLGVLIWNMAFVGKYAILVGFVG